LHGRDRLHRRADYFNSSGNEFPLFAPTT